MTAPTAPTAGAGFLCDPPASEAADRLAAADQATHGYVMNCTRLWSHSPVAKEQLFAALQTLTDSGELSMRQRGVLIASMARAVGDSYCALAWGGRLSAAADDETARAVLRGEDEALDLQDLALARWARTVVTAPSSTTEDDVQALRDAGLSDAQVFAVTAFVALRQAWSVVNGALGARPDAELVAGLPGAVTGSVDWGRPPVAAGPVT